MDELWDEIKDKFHLCLTCLPDYNNIVNNISSMNFKEIPNILLHGCHGIPFNFIWNIALHKKFGEFTKLKRVWGKDVITYYETPYFFEIDLLYPHQTRDMVLFSEFIKDIVSHPCIHEDRHIIVFENIDQVSDRIRSTALRVLLERFSKNAFFICTTSHIGQIELPIRSRFLNIRCRAFTPDEMEGCFTILKRQYHPLLKKNGCYDFYYALFISYLIEKYPDQINESLCNYKLPFFHNFLITTLNQSPTIEEIRKITQQVSIHNASFNMIAHDLLLFYKDYPDEWKMIITHYCCEIDHMCSTTEEYRKPLYIEYLLNKIFYHINKYNYKSQTVIQITSNDTNVNPNNNLDDNSELNNINEEINQENDIQIISKPKKIYKSRKTTKESKTTESNVKIVATPKRRSKKSTSIDNKIEELRIN